MGRILTEVARTWAGAALGLGLGALLLAASGPSLAGGIGPQTPPAAVDAAVQAQALGPGVNALGFDPMWQVETGGRPRFTAAHFRRIHDAGFRSVRVVLFGFRHMDADNRLDPRWLARLDDVVREGTAAGLSLILENQDMAECGQDPPACQPRLIAFWRQVAARYRAAPSGVVFELLNEPNSKLDPVWNSWIPPLLAAVRETNPTRNVVVDATGWASLRRLNELKLPPADRHLIVAIHYYDPRPFTHQGAPFAEDTRDLKNVDWGSAADRTRLHDDFAAAAAWSRANGRPLLLGEFGAYEKADMAARARYLGAVAREAESHGWAWLVWQFDHDFAVYDMARDNWVEPLLHALIPQAPARRPAS